MQQLLHDEKHTEHASEKKPLLMTVSFFLFSANFNAYADLDDSTALLTAH